MPSNTNQLVTLLFCSGLRGLFGYMRLKALTGETDRATGMGDVAIITGGTGAIGGAVAATLQDSMITIVAADLDESPVPAGQVFSHAT